MDIKDALKEIDDTYKQLQPMVDDVVNRHTKDIDVIFKNIKKDITTLSNKELQDYMLQLQAEAFDLTAVKDSSALKQELALTILKTKQATIYSATAGTSAARNNQATIDTVDKQVVSALYNAINNRFKSKLDEVHRMINVLSNVLISKNAEAKLRGGSRDDDTHSNDIWKDY